MNDEDAKIELKDIYNLLKTIHTSNLANKTTLNFKEATDFLGLSPSYLYKLTSCQEIPHYKPKGKLVYFDRSELESWLRQGKVNSLENIDKKASNHVALGGV
jgi:excisionase family DNA binding protein